MTLLLLAGTAEARVLNQAISHRTDLVTSLAGVTDNPRALAGKVRRGGFGGADGLARFIDAHDIRAVIDATHPFAAQMSANAAKAAEGRCPLLQLLRPEWPSAQNWQTASSLRAAADMLPRGARVFLATGRASLDNFAHRQDVTFICRVMDDRPGSFPIPGGKYLVSQPPFTIAQEVETLQAERVACLVSRNSGGDGGTEKLEACARLGIPVIMVERPDLPDAERAATVEEAVAWLEAKGWLDA